MAQKKQSKISTVDSAVIRNSRFEVTFIPRWRKNL